MAKYMTRQGEELNLTPEEYASYPFNSKLMLIEQEKKTKKKKISKGE